MALNEDILPIVAELLETDSDEDIIFNMLCKQRKKRRCINNYVNNVAMCYSLDDFKSHFRLKRGTFEKVLTTIGPYLIKENETGRPTSPPETQLLIALTMLSNQAVYRIISEKFDVSKSTAWTFVHKICKILGSLSPDYIKWPTGDEILNTVKGFEERHNFPNVIGAVDGSHIPITAPRKQQAVYCNRKGYHSIVLQGICNSKYEFTDVYAGYPGRVHDARVFANSEIGKKMEENGEELFLNNTHLLGDSAYKNGVYMLTPYKDNGHLTGLQKNYNFKHSSTRVCIEQTFGLLKGRFRILKHVNIYNTELIPPLILACCVLHNMCMQNKDDDVEAIFDEPEAPDTPNNHSNERDLTGDIKRNNIAMLLKQ